jgi:hypothetical protein
LHVWRIFTREERDERTVIASPIFMKRCSLKILTMRERRVNRKILVLPALMPSSS